jgi:hypothetical protein
MKNLIALTLIACGFSLQAADPSTTSRRVSYHDSDIVPIMTEVRFTTLIELPSRITRSYHVWRKGPRYNG